MKKIFSLLLALLVFMSFSACKDDSSDAPSSDIEGYWKLVDDTYGEYYHFADDGVVQVIRGSVTFEGEAEIAPYEDGGYVYSSEFQYLYGTLIFTLSEDKNTLSILPTDSDSESNGQAMTRAEFTAPELTPDKNAEIDKDLVGYWYNDTYMDSYEFTKDGYATYILDQTEVYGFISKVEYVYSADGKKAELTYHTGDSYEVYPGGEYTLNGDTLIIDGNEYTRAEKPAD
ncbi:MAG: hypothetical protein IJC86_01565 [Clostridia bacterium]|nr:hypothetical protein [Clostridia bacterium]